MIQKILRFCQRTERRRRQKKGHIEKFLISENPDFQTTTKLIGVYYILYINLLQQIGQQLS